MVTGATPSQWPAVRGCLHSAAGYLEACGFGTASNFLTDVIRRVTLSLKITSLEDHF